MESEELNHGDRLEERQVWMDNLGLLDRQEACLQRPLLVFVSKENR